VLLAASSAGRLHPSVAAHGAPAGGRSAAGPCLAVGSTSVVLGRRPSSGVPGTAGLWPSGRPPLSGPATTEPRRPDPARAASLLM
jgi:hypothetical protein